MQQKKETKKQENFRDIEKFFKKRLCKTNLYKKRHENEYYSTVQYQRENISY